jgi:segregation and condensation protein A
MDFVEDHNKQDDDTFILKFDAWEGPIEALLELARNQKVDLAAINLLELIDQYEVVVVRAMALRIELAADWLVMATWLTYLKSKILLKRPKDRKTDVLSDDILAFHLKRLALVKSAYDQHAERLAIGRDWFGPAVRQVDFAANSKIGRSFREFLLSYPKPDAGVIPSDNPSMPTFDVASIESALARLGRSMPPEWTELMNFIPHSSGLRLRSHIATSLVAALEMTKSHRADIRQEDTSSPVMVRRLEFET